MNTIGWAILACGVISADIAYYYKQNEAWQGSVGAGVMAAVMFLSIAMMLISTFKS